jgi:hypothetical protein
MQLIEFFIWKNINNKFYNNIFTVCVLLLLLSQPIASIMIISNIQLRNLLLVLYLSLVIPFIIYNFSSKHILTAVSGSGHLIWWKYFVIHPVGWFVWFSFLLFSFIYEQKWFGLMFALFSLLIAYLNFTNDDSMGSMWCWGINSIMIYYALYLLIYLPFLEKYNIR